MVRNPSYFFDAAPERALVNPDNLHILVDHVKCAAFELPFTTSEQYGRHDVQEVLGVLAESGFVHRTDSDASGEAIWQWTNESYPADAVSLRSISSDNFVVIDTTDGSDVIGETSFTSGPSTLHEKAIYLVEGVLYQVEWLDFEGRKAYVRRIDCDYYTDAITYTKVAVLETFAGEQRAVRLWRQAGRGGVIRVQPDGMLLTARSTSLPALSDSRRSSSTRTRTSGRASWIFLSSRCTPRPTG